MVFAGPTIRVSATIQAARIRGCRSSTFFQHLARKKIELNEDMQVELLQLLRSGVASNLLQSLQVVKIIEGFAKGNASARARREMEAAIAWLKDLTDHCGMKFKAAALHRFEKALQSMAAPVAAPNGPASSTEVDAETARPAAPILPGGFGRRVVLPIGGAAADLKEAASGLSDEPPLAPPTKPDNPGRPTSIVDFYGNLADLRKCSAEHFAFLDGLILSDVDEEADLRRNVAENNHLRGLR